MQEVVGSIPIGSTNFPKNLYCAGIGTDEVLKTAAQACAAGMTKITWNEYIF
jgi:hypothetical protein